MKNCVNLKELWEILTSDEPTIIVLNEENEDKIKEIYEKNSII